MAVRREHRLEQALQRIMEEIWNCVEDGTLNELVVRSNAAWIEANAVLSEEMKTDRLWIDVQDLNL